ncbi:hypothetical protein GQ53DRAFT_824097 [Thozetella sp. PMI_491]|nr:hypothetical protein GQ53DRAFT_824097 [Thozetella sp. PMI_491]
MESHAASPPSSSRSRDHAPTDHSSSPNAASDGHRTSQDSLLFDHDDSKHDAAAERHPKGKRKRTAAKDKAVLEAAYNANPKPDKAARLDIVSRVSLNEKEVQIWFQNRRQNDRRKSRPLSPQEIAALRYGGMQIISSDPPMPYSSFGSDSVEPSPSHSSAWPTQNPTSPGQSEAAPRPGSADEMEKTDGRPSGPQPRLDLDKDATPEAGTPPQKGSASEPGSSSQGLSQSFSSTVGYLANRWNPGSSFSTPSTLGNRGEESIRLESFSSSTCSSTPVLPPPSSQSSQFRLSLSLEGKAEVVSSITSPPSLSASRPSAGSLQSLGPVPRPQLQRSHSASASVTLPPISALTSSLPKTVSGALPPRLTRGRSRDVHAWEFCCDAKNQEDPLTVQAKHESSGSAIAAISLLRSTSSAGGSPLQPSSSKRNAATSRAAPRGGMAKRPRLGRTQSTVGRLQTNLGPGDEKCADKDDNGKLKVSMLLSPSGNDSDKENWSPDEEGNPQHRHQLPSGRRPLPSSTSHHPKRRVLQDYRNPVFRANTAPAPGRRRGEKHDQSMDIFEDEENHSRPSMGEDEVERFMRGEVSPSKKGDVDAVAGLLSLSQGNWR